MILETERLRLREMTRDDLEFVAAMVGDAEVMRYYPKVLDRNGAERWLERQLERYARDGHGLWLVEDRATGAPVGQVGLIRQIVEAVPHPEIGYLIHRPFWRRGYAVEAATGVRKHAFTERGLDRVISLVRPENVPSQRTALRLGMKPERLVTFNELPHVVFAVERSGIGERT